MTMQYIKGLTTTKKQSVPSIRGQRLQKNLLLFITHLMRSIAFFLIFLLLLSCKSKVSTKDSTLSSLDLKRGEIISCGPQEGEIFGMVSFSSTVPTNLQHDFNTAIALLHSFEYDEAEKMFATVIDKAPDCAMAYWGVAMSNFHPLWVPPAPAELQKGMQAIQIARSIKNKTKRETDYIEAMGQFYENAEHSDHRTRVLNFETAMESVYKTYPDDKEASIFYALALNAAADPSDKTYTRQRKAFAILSPIFQQEPLHPGIVHYLIHSYDYPELSAIALPAARKYATIAPASAHAQHMPSHIFTNLGLWDECIQSNLVSVSAAKCYAEKAKIKGHWDEELHGMDYLVYAYLQKKEDALAKQQLDYLQTINEVYPVNFKVAYAFAAIPARYALERKDWKQAAALSIHPLNFPWDKFPWQKAIIHFARVMGHVHLNNVNAAEKELDTLKAAYEKLKDQKNKALEAAQVAVQINASEGWIEYKKGNNEKALALMKAAADAEDATEKHPVTPCAVIPARELLGELLLEMNQPSLAIIAFEQDLKLHPNRRNGLIGLKASKEKAN
jgi:tetratricopeptide (TPR) repeat protein